MNEKAKFSDFYKENKTDTLWWCDSIETEGDVFFSFDQKKIHGVFADYPHNLTKEEKEIFDKESKFWADFLAWRN